jgi:hypothetical protein
MSKLVMEPDDAGRRLRWRNSVGSRLEQPVVDQEFNRFAIDLLHSADRLLFGRVTYEGMAAYWSNAQ